MYSAAVVQKVLLKSREPWRWGVPWLAIRSWQWPIERIIKTASLRTTWEVAQELSIDHSVIIRHLQQIGKMEGLIKWCLMSWPQIKKKKNHHFEVTCSLILCSSEQFLAWIVACKEKCILYNNWQHQAQWLDWEEAPKHFLKSNLHRKKVMVPVWWFVACLTHYSFLNPSKTITSKKYVQEIIEIHRKLLHLQLALVASGPNSSPWKCLITHHTTIASKVEWIGLQSFASATISPDLSLMNYHLFKHPDNFLQGKHFHISWKQKMLTESASNLKTWIICYSNKQTYFLLAKMCWL